VAAFWCGYYGTFLPWQRRLVATMTPNKSLDASGGSVFLNLIHPAMLV